LATGKALDERLARPGMDVRVATDADLAVVERYLVAREHPLVVRADDLTQKQLRLAALGDRYASLGLVRRREVLVASYRGHRVGFALAERASHGLNLYGGLSSFRVYVTSDEGELADATRLALLQALQGHYAAAGQQSSMGLVPVEHAPSYERLGLTVPAQSYCLTMHRSVVPVALSHVDRVTRK
jgi:hypothetical protein